MATQIQVHGTVAPGFERVRDEFAKNFERRGELGAAFTVLREGEPIVDLWGGLASREPERPFEPETLSVIFSSTKGLAALCLLMLADRGQLDYDQPVARYWPSFAKKGKEAITVRQIVEHKAGLVGFEVPLTIDDLAAWEPVVWALENAAPQWPPGTAQGYHGITFGALASELFFRITGERLGRFFAREVAAPLGLDAFIGLPESRGPDLADLYGPDLKEKLTKVLPAVFKRSLDGRVFRSALKRGSWTRRAFAHPHDLGRTGIQRFAQPRVRSLELAWAGGIANARSLARLYGALAMGGAIDGTRLVREETLARVYPHPGFNDDRVLRKPLAWSHGFIKEEPHLFSPNLESFGHPGLGGSLGLADPKARLGIGYVLNKTEPAIRSPRAIALCHALYACL